MNLEIIKNEIVIGSTSLGIELGSTRIKTILIGSNYQPLASGSFNWENAYENGIWTYSLDNVERGLQESYRELVKDVETKYDVKLTKVGAIGISAMMHGYLVFDSSDRLLVPFRTWRNTITEQAATILTREFNFNIPLRWSIAHLYQAILNHEPHVSEISYMTTLAGYIHWRLTGKKVLGIGDASGMFPIDTETKNYDSDMIEKFNAIVSENKFNWRLAEILPKVFVAGDEAGTLTPQGAQLIDPTGTLVSGIPFCPPEGDAGTGMTATNSIGERTGNVSAGTSIFAMVVLEKKLSKVYPEIDIVTTPAGSPVAMVHCNNCTSDLDAWSRIFVDFSKMMGFESDKNELFTALYSAALEGDADCGKILSYNYLSGETITGFDEGRPLIVRMPDSRLNLPNFMRSLIFSALGSLRIGMETLRGENVRIDKLLGHGGFYKTKGVGQKFTAAALETPVSVMSTAGEGGAWGVALLAAYCQRKNRAMTLNDFLSTEVFANLKEIVLQPKPADIASFKEFVEVYKQGLMIERAAVDNLNWN